MNTESLAASMRQAYERAKQKGFVSSGRTSLSARIPGEEAFLRTEDGNEIVSIPSGSGLLDDWLYRQRPDVGAVYLGEPCWGSSLASLSGEMPSVFDEQVRQLGDGVGRLRWPMSGSPPSKMTDGNNVFLCEGRVLILGYSLDRAIFNLELFEKCAKSYVLAVLAGGRSTKIPWWVRKIAHGRLRKDERKAAEAYRAGTFPTGLGGY